MLSVPLADAIEQRLGEVARSRGQTEVDLARELIEVGLDDIVDIEMASHRLESRQPALDSDQARMALGLDD